MKKLGNSLDVDPWEEMGILSMISCGRWFRHQLYRLMKWHKLGNNKQKLGQCLCGKIKDTELALEKVSLRSLREIKSQDYEFPVSPYSFSFCSSTMSIEILIWVLRVFYLFVCLFKELSIVSQSQIGFVTRRTVS